MAAVVAATLLGGLGASCRGPEPVVLYDLAERAAVADHDGAALVIRFGTPGAEPYQIAGFYPEAQARLDSYLWVKEEAELDLPFEAPAERVAILDAAPYDGVPNQHLEADLNGEPLGRLAMNDGRHRYRIPLPASAQVAGVNRLRLFFRDTGSPVERDPGSGDRRHLAAAVYGMAIGASGDPALEDLLARDAPPALGVVTEGGLPVLRQAGPGRLRFALRAPADAELRFTPRLHPQARAAAATLTFSVTVEPSGAPPRDAWSLTLDARSATPGEQAVPLRCGGACRVTLALDAERGTRFAWGDWEAPRVLGPGPPPTFELPAPVEEDADPDLRARLGPLNVVLVVLDAARASQLGCYGYGRDTTPHIDRLAEEGILFEAAYAPAVYTLGAMSSLWTSQHPERHHEDVSYADRLPADRLTLAEAITAKGLHAAGFVANAMAGGGLGFDRGFSEFHEVYQRFPEIGSRAEAFARVLPDWFAARRNERFFAYVHFREPHFPYDPPAPWPTRFGPDAPLDTAQRRAHDWYTAVNRGEIVPTPEQIAHLVRLYDANLAYVDAQVGVLRETLEANGLLKRTAIVVIADHGEQLHEHGYISHSAQVYEESVRIPLIVRLPAAARRAGVRIDGLTDLRDVAPTILDLLALDSRAAREAFQGRSLLRWLDGLERPFVLSRTVWDRPVYALRDVQRKLIYDTRTGRTELYDLASDPRERRNLAAAEPIVADVYRQDLMAWVRSLHPGGSAGGAAQREAAELTKEQCENLKSLGYIKGDVPCPED